MAERFRRALARGRLATTFLFVGPPGVGKRAFALKLAESLFCQTRPAERLAPCGECSGCVQTRAGSHPDLHIVAKPADRGFIPVAAFIGDDEHRMREGLCHDIALKPYMGGRRVAIIDDADFLNEEGANALLKTLEEPPPKSVLILIGTSAERQLPTIRSRAQIVRFSPLDEQVVARLLVERSGVAAAEAARLAALSEGSLERAAEMADPDLWAFRSRLLGDLSTRPLPSVALAQDLEAFVNDAGAEASRRRARARQTMALALQFFRQALRESVEAGSDADPELTRALERSRAAWGVVPDAPLALVERTLAALAHIERNANQSTLIACWLDDLARIVDTGRAPSPFEPAAYV